MWKTIPAGIRLPQAAKRPFAWASIIGAPFVLKANRWQVVESLAEQRSQFQTCETFDGLLVPLIMTLYRRDIQREFNSAGLR
jgi:hypothetical protein